MTFLIYLIFFHNSSRNFLSSSLLLSPVKKVFSVVHAVYSLYFWFIMFLHCSCAILLQLFENCLRNTSGPYCILWIDMGFEFYHMGFLGNLNIFFKVTMPLKYSLSISCPDYLVVYSIFYRFFHRWCSPLYDYSDFQLCLKRYKILKHFNYFLKSLYLV